MRANHRQIIDGARNARATSFAHRAARRNVVGQELLSPAGDLHERAESSYSCFY
jgi:hypothetical protein